MIDETRVFSRPLGYALLALSVFISLAEIVITATTGGHPPHYNPVVEEIVFALGLVIVPVSFVLAMKYAAAKIPAIVLFNIYMGMLIIWYSEAFSPFTSLWSLMILFASIYYGWRGFVASVISLATICALYCALFPSDLTWGGSVYIPLVVMVVFLTSLTSFLFVKIIMNGHSKNVQLQEAQEAEQLQVNRQSTLLNSISDAVLTLNRYGRITSENAAAQAFFDTNESLIGKDIDKLLQVTDRVNKTVSTRNLIEFTKTTLLREDLSTGSGNETRHLSVQMARIRSTFDDEEEYGVVLIIRDITKQKTLEDEKDEFISVTSHELRTPVAIAEGSLSNLLVMYERDSNPEKLRDAAKGAYDQVIYLAKIINDLSTLSRAERGVGDGVEELDINELLHDMFNRYTNEAEEKGLQLNLDAQPDLPEVTTSRLYLEEILQNFITNAIKYTKKGSVTLGGKLVQPGKISLWVTDTGIGIGKSDLPKIFDKFYRSEDYRTRETSGTGLGLYVVEKLANKLGTKVNVESRLNSGSTFSIDVDYKTVNSEDVYKDVIEVESKAVKSL